MLNNRCRFFRFSASRVKKLGETPNVEMANYHFMP